MSAAADTAPLQVVDRFADRAESTEARLIASGCSAPLGRTRRAPPRDARRSKAIWAPRALLPERGVR